MESSIINYSYSIIGNNTGINWEKIISIIIALLSLIIAYKTYKIAMDAVDNWKKQVKYENITSIKKELIKVIVDYFYTLDIYAQNIDAEKQSTINEELTIKSIDTQKNINMYLYFSEADKKQFDELKNELDKYKESVLNLKFKHESFSDKDNSDYNYKQTLQNDITNIETEIKSIKQSCEEKINNINLLLKKE